MQNFVFVISTLQEADSFFSFAFALKNEKKDVNIITIIESQDFYEQLKKNRSLFVGLRRIGKIIYKKNKKIKIFRKIYNLFWIIKLLFILMRFKKPSLLTGGNFNNIYRITLQFFCTKKKGKCFILMPHSFIWFYQYKQFRRNATLTNFKRTIWQKFFNLKIKGFIFYNNKQLPFARIVQKNLNFKPNQLCLTGLGTNTKHYKDFFSQELKKYKKTLGYLKNSNNKKIFSIICGSQGTSFGMSLLLKEDSQKRILKLIINEIIKYKKDAIILLRRHPNDVQNKSHVLDVAREAKLKNNIFFTNLHPQILSKISSRVITYTRTNVMTDVFNTKKIDCSEYKKIDLTRNSGKNPGNYGYGVIYINPQKSNFNLKFKQALKNDYLFSKKEICKQEKKLIEENKFNYKRVEKFFNTV